MYLNRSEKNIQTDILKKLRKIPNSWWFKCHDLITAGVPDILGAIEGKFIAIEVKKPGEVPTVLQKQVIHEMNKAGIYAFWDDNTKLVMEKIVTFQTNNILREREKYKRRF